MWRNNFNYFVRTAETELQTISLVTLMNTHTHVSHTDVSTLEENFPASLSPQAEKVICAESKLLMWLISRPQTPDPVPAATDCLYQKEVMDFMFSMLLIHSDRRCGREHRSTASEPYACWVHSSSQGVGRVRRCNAREEAARKQAPQHFVLSLSRSLYMPVAFLSKWKTISTCTNWA